MDEQFTYRKEGGQIPKQIIHLGERPLALTKKQKQVLNFIQSNPVSTYQEIADGLDIAKSTVGNSLKPMCDIGLVKKNGDGRFHVQGS